MSRKSRSLAEIANGDVLLITEACRLFQERGWSKADIRRAFEEAVLQEKNRPHGSLFPQGEKCELATICKNLRVSPNELKKRYPLQR